MTGYLSELRTALKDYDKNKVIENKSRIGTGKISGYVIIKKQEQNSPST